MSTEATPTNESTTSNPGISVDTKIMSDLGTVKDKMDLCNKMLHPGDGSPAPSLKNNEALLGVIGFLEACAPRMVELVEAATLGALSEAVLMECLTVNDRLLKLLADIDTYAFTETPATTTAASAPAKTVEQEFNDLLLDDSNTSDKKPEPAVGKSTGDEDPFAGPVDLLTPTPVDTTTSSDAAKPAAQKQDDPFDGFLEERTGGN